MKWKNWDESNNTWEPTQNLVGCGEKLKDFYFKRVAEREAASDAKYDYLLTKLGNRQEKINS